MSSLSASAVVTTTGMLDPVGTSIPGDIAPFNPVAGSIGTFFTPTTPVRIALPKFNPSLGTLLSAVIRVNGFVQARLTVENRENAAAQNVSATLDGTLRLFQDTGFDGLFAPGTDTNVTIAAAFGLASPSVSLAAADILPGAGPDFHDFGLLSSGVTPTQSINIAAGQFGNYTGAPGSEVYVFVGATTPFTVSGLANSTTNLANSFASANVTIEYTYNSIDQEIPETSSVVALGALFAFGLSSRNRRRK